MTVVQIGPSSAHAALPLAEEKRGADRLAWRTRFSSDPTVTLRRPRAARPPRA